MSSIIKTVNQNEVYINSRPIPSQGVTTTLGYKKTHIRDGSPIVGEYFKHVPTEKFIALCKECLESGNEGFINADDKTKITLKVSKLEADVAIKFVVITFQHKEEHETLDIQETFTQEEFERVLRWDCVDKFTIQAA